MERLSELAGRGLRLVDYLALALAAVGGVAVVALVSFITVAVFFRYVVNDPIFGAEDVASMLLSAAVAGSIAYGARSGAHVFVDMLGMVGGRKVTRYTDIVVRLGEIGVAALLAYALVEQGLCGRTCGYFTPNIEIPELPFYLLLGAGVGVYALVLVFELIIGLTHFRAERDPNEYE